MPIKITQNTVKEGMDNLGTSLIEAVRNGLTAVAIESAKNTRDRQANNEFWNNQSGNAIDSISGEMQDGEKSIGVAIGFEDGRPNEKDAPGFYSGRDHEYAEYIADRDGMSFTTVMQQILTDNLNRMMGSLGVKLNFTSSRGKRSDK